MVYTMVFNPLSLVVIGVFSSAKMFGVVPLEASGDSVGIAFSLSGRHVSATHVVSARRGCRWYRFLSAVLIFCVFASFRCV
jgi:hypothetical protein